MTWKPSQVPEGGIPPYNCSHEETDPRDSLPSLLSCLNATGNDSHPTPPHAQFVIIWPFMGLNMALHGAVSQTNVNIGLKRRRRRRKVECVIRIGNNSNYFNGRFLPTGRCPSTTE